MAAPVDALSLVCARSWAGIGMHADMRDVFYFMGLDGYGELQRYRFIDESLGNDVLRRYVVQKLGRMPDWEPWPRIEVVPAGWGASFSADHGEDERRSTVRRLFDRWVSWESETKDALSKRASELREFGDGASALFVERVCESTASELAVALSMRGSLEACGYDMPTAVGLQPDLRRRYKKEIGRLL